MKVVFSLISLFISVSAFSFEPYNFEVKAEKGDGIFSLLRKYYLLDHSCSTNRFLELNNLQIDDPLHHGKMYKLPIKIYEYNGTSIRTSIGINNWEQAIRIKKFNEQILESKLRKTDYTESKILWVPYHELNCTDAETGLEKASEAVASTPPIEEKKGNYKQIDIFGKKNSLVEIIDESLKGEVYYLVSGHGGPDPGAMCHGHVHNYCEDEYAYDIALRLARYLIQHGATTHIIIQDENDGIREEEELDCDIDEHCEGAKLPVNQLKRLRQRSDAINRLYIQHKKKGAQKQVAIMIHVDSYTDKERRQDAYFYYHKKSKSSKVLAESLESTFKQKYDTFQKDRGYKGFVKTRNLYMLNNTYPSSVYVELANIQNPDDRKRIVMADNREALAKWMYEALSKAQI